ncbi:MAG: ribonuclease P protein component, partial [Gemmatimonadales bacterium]
AVFQHGSRIERPRFIAMWRRAETRRAGFAVSRQLRGAALRNRARRRIREAYRRVRALIGADIEMVVVARPSAATRPFPELVEDMRRLAEKLARAAAELQA